MPQVQVIQPIQQQPKRLRVAAYARVSSDSEDQLNSLAVQVDYYTHLIQENPNWEFAGIYTDEGITGTSTKRREQFNRLMDDCRAGLIDRVLVMMHLAMMLLIKRFVLVRLFFTICSVLLNFQSKKISRDVDMLDA